MERNENYDHFEQFLKDSVDDFRMYPSDRVWSSLYNNLHPGRKWPSVAMLLFMVSAILYVGSSNNQLVSENVAITTGRVNTAELFAVQTAMPSEENAGNQVLSTNPAQLGNATVHGELQEAGYDLNRTNQADSKPYNLNNDIVYTKSKNRPVDLFDAQTKNSNSSNDDLIALQTEQTGNIQVGILQANLSDVHQTNDSNSGDGSHVKVFPGTDDNIIVIDSETPATETAIAVAVANNNNTVDLTAEPVLIDREWIDNYAFYNKPKSPFRSKLTYQVYVTPSVGFRTMTKNSDISISTASFAPGNNQVTEKFHHLPALNVEAGYSLNYYFSKIVRFKAGFQFNYSNYRIQAQEMKHPTATALMLNNLSNGEAEILYRPSNISNSIGEDNNRHYNTNSFQVSVPIGADLRLAGKENLQWFIGATIQPTYVLSGNAFLASADMKNYVVDNSFLRKWNMNAGFETFVTYKLNNGITLNAGPQFRYQLRSTFSNRYTFNERLYNVGLKMGIIQQF